MPTTIPNLDPGTAPIWRLSIAAFLGMCVLLQLSYPLLSHDNIVLVLLFQGFIAVWTTYIMHRNAISLPSIIGRSRNRRLELSWLAALAVPLAIAGSALGLMLYGLASAQPEMLLKSFGGHGAKEPNTAVLAVLSIGIAPVIEELAFRGLLFNVLCTRTTTGRALIYSSLIFASLHAQTFGIVQFFMSILFTLAYLHTRWLVIPMLLHSFWNAVPAFASAFSGRTGHDAPSMADVQQLAQTMHPWVPVLGGMLVLSLVAAVYSLRRFWPSPKALAPYQCNLTT